jgi:hypothetical protein
MATIALGSAPLAVEVELSPGADFNCVLRNPNGNWPAGIAVELRFADTGATVWPATVVADEIRFSVDKAQVDTLIAGKPGKARLFYVDGSADLYWAGGKVKVNA